MLTDKKKAGDDIGETALNIHDTLKRVQKSDLALQKQACTLAPIMLIPPEILRPILAAVKPEDFTLPINKALLLRLMLVCRIWAAIIRDMPEMWTTIEVTRGLNVQRWLAGHVMISKWNAAPLDIIFHGAVQCDELLAHLLQRRRNWRRIQFYYWDSCINFRQLARILLALEDASNLRELEIVDREYVFWGLSGPSRASIFLPSLESLKLWKMNHVSCFLRLPGLTYLECESVQFTADEFYGWAEGMPKLRSIRIHDIFLNAQPGEFHNDSRRLIASPPKFPSLEELVVDASTCRDNRGHIFYLAIMAGSANLTTVHLSTSAAQHVEKSGDILRKVRMPQIKTLIVLVDTIHSQWGRHDLNIYLDLFSGVENLEIDQRRRNSKKAMIKVLRATPNPTNKHFTALPPRIQTLLFNFSHVVDSRLVNELRSFALAMTEENGLNPPYQCRFSIQVGKRFLIRDAAAVQLADFLRTSCGLTIATTRRMPLQAAVLLLSTFISPFHGTMSTVFRQLEDASLSKLWLSSCT